MGFLNILYVHSVYFKKKQKKQPNTDFMLAIPKKIGFKI